MLMQPRRARDVCAWPPRQTETRDKSLGWDMDAETRSARGNQPRSTPLPPRSPEKAGMPAIADSAQRRPRLLILSPDFPPAHGGIQSLVHNLALTMTGFVIE